MTRILSYSEYCQNRVARINSLYVFKQGEEPYYVIHGEKIPESEIDARYPVTGKIVEQRKKRAGRGHDIDGTKNWMNR